MCLCANGRSSKDRYLQAGFQLYLLKCLRHRAQAGACMGSTADRRFLQARCNAGGYLVPSLKTPQVLGAFIEDPTGAWCLH